MDLLELLDRPIAFQRSFVTLTGSINAALMLSQGFYWGNRTEDPEGWFFKTRDEWTDETGLTHEQQETARKRLRALAIWEEKEERLVHRVWFRIRPDVLRDEIKKLPVSPNRKSRRGYAGKNGSGSELFTVPSIQAETTTERGGEAADVAAFQIHWNSTLPEPFPQIKVMSSGRVRALGARLREPGWRENWKAALERMPGCPFLKGENPRKWTADADFFLRPDSVAKILEGKYDGDAAPAPRQPDEFRKHL